MKLMLSTENPRHDGGRSRARLVAIDATRSAPLLLATSPGLIVLFSRLFFGSLHYARQKMSMRILGIKGVLRSLVTKKPAAMIVFIFIA